MSSTLLNDRWGTFSSSNIWKLMGTSKSGGFGKPAEKYVKQVRYEIALGRPINAERESRPTSWGKFVERRAFDLLGMEYQLVSDGRLFHPEIKQWSGAPDLLKGVDVIADVKSPFSLEVFCDKLIALQDIEKYKKDFPEDYWQLVSNAILTNRSKAEAVIYVPYQSELEDIRDLTHNEVEQKVQWIQFANDLELPYVNKGGKFLNLNVVAFDIPASDKELLTQRVKSAIELL